MKVLMLSTDRKILEIGSGVGRRVAGYGTFCESLTVMVVGTGERVEQILAPNVIAISPGGNGKIDAFTRAIDEGARLGRATGITVVTAQDPFFIGLAGVQIARRLKVPLQVQIHTDFMNPAYVYESPKHFIESLVAWWVLAQASCIRAVSERAAKSARRMAKAPVLVLPIHVSPVPTSSTTPLPEFKDQPTFITVSRLAPEKRIHLVIDALAQVPGAELVIVGDGALKSSLEARARNRNVSERVHLVGWKDDLAPYYAHAAAFIQMSRYEGYGMALVDAAFSGCPIVATDAGVVGEVVKKEDMLVVRPNTSSLAHALTNILEHADDARARAARARATAALHTMNEAQYHQAYKACLEQCGG